MERSMRQINKALSTGEGKRTAAPSVRVAPVARTRRVRALTAQQEDLVSQYVPKARRGLRKLMREDNRHADLTAVFPGAAYALATPCRPAGVRREAAKLVVEGAPLKHIAKCLGLPMWLRRLPPKAFCGDLKDIPMGEAFSRRIANRIPAGRDANAFWLEAVCFGARGCGEEFALWIANQRIFAKYGEAEPLYATLAAYAWHSRETRNLANGLIVVPWHPEIAFDTALCAAKSWLNRLRLLMQLEDGALTDPWLKGLEVDGFCFSPLLDCDHLLKESQAMHNCADQYSSHLARERCRLFSVTRRGQHVATLEIGPHPRETGILTITQLKGRHNMPASLSVWQAAHAWLSKQGGLKRMTPRSGKDLPFNTRTWIELTADYRAKTDGAPWLPSEPNPVAFHRLENGLADLARRAGVRSWLFTGG